MEYLTLYNTKPDELRLWAKENDVLDMDLYVNYFHDEASNSFKVRLNEEPDQGDPFAMLCVRFRVRRKDGLLLKEWLSCVSPSELVVTAGLISVLDEDGFDQSGLFDYDVCVNNGEGWFTIMTGMWTVKKSI